MDQKTAYCQTNSQIEFFLVFGILDIQRLLYTSLYHVCLHCCDMYFGCWCREKKQQPPIANWSYLFYPFNSQAKVCTGLSLWGTLKIPLSIRRLQPCGRKCAVTGVRFPSVMNWGMVGDHSHTCHEHPWTKKFGRGCSQYRQWKCQLTGTDQIWSPRSRKSILKNT